MATLVVGNDLLLCIGDQAALALWAGHDAIECLCELVHANRALAPTCGEDRSFIHKVGKISSRESRRTAPDLFQVHRLVERLPLHVHLQDRNATLQVWAIKDHLAIESAWAQQRRIKHVRTVRGGDDNHVGTSLKAVHLHEDLIQRLLALIVRSAESGATLATDGVNLIDEHDARRVALGLIEEVAHTRGTNTNEHLNELGARDAEERHASLTGNGTGEEGLSCARRADQEHALRDLCAQRFEALWELQEFNDLFEFNLRLLDACDIGKGDGGLVCNEHLRLALAEAHRLIVLPLRAAHHEDEESADQKHR